MEAELTTMVMVRDVATGRVLVQDRVKSWKGLSFPGGHVEAGESFVDCAVREVREETGLDVRNLTACGIIHWLNMENDGRYIVFLYKTEDYSGTLIDATDEGRNFWIDVETLKTLPSENGFDRYWPMIFDGKHSEAFGPYRKDEPFEVMYK